jgi:hypothetical protein
MPLTLPSTGYGTRIMLNWSPPFWENATTTAAVILNFSIPQTCAVCGGVFGKRPFGEPGERR